MAEPTVAVQRADLAIVLAQRTGHSHTRPGIWDDDNIESGLAGKPCVECAARSRLTWAIADSVVSEYAAEVGQ